jgi:hypothetical protein
MAVEATDHNSHPPNTRAQNEFYQAPLSDSDQRTQWLVFLEVIGQSEQLPALSLQLN